MVDVVLMVIAGEAVPISSSTKKKQKTARVLDLGCELACQCFAGLTFEDAAL
jgi:hypothetical protein